MTPRLKEIYNKEIQPALKDSLGLKNMSKLPRKKKVELYLKKALFIYQTLS